MLRLVYYKVFNMSDEELKAYGPGYKFYIFYTPQKYALSVKDVLEVWNEILKDIPNLEMGRNEVYEIPDTLTGDYANYTGIKIGVSAENLIKLRNEGKLMKYGKWDHIFCCKLVKF